ncbi:MAG: hypothetical protein V7607_2429 [Solirubrobacteraceae bacterium]
MNRFTMSLTAAAASALVAGATVALPAIGDDSGPSPAKPVDNDVSAFAACLSDHGLPGAPTTGYELKQWLGAKEVSDPAAAKKAMNACSPPDSKPERRQATAVDAQKLVACLRANGLDAPTDPAALKPWLKQKEDSDPAAVKRAMMTCKMQLAPAAAKGAKPGVCGDDAAKPGGEAAKPEEARPAEPSTDTSTPST